MDSTLEQQQIESFQCVLVMYFGTIQDLWQKGLKCVAEDYIFNNKISNNEGETTTVEAKAYRSVTKWGRKKNPINSLSNAMSTAGHVFALHPQACASL